MQKRSTKKILAGKKGNMTNMSPYKEVSIKHMLFGGEMTCLEKFCTGGSDMKVGCSWAQFKGNYIDAIETVKIEQDITVVNIPNFRDVGIEPMAKLILKELGPWCEIKDISAWRRFDNNQYLPYGIKVLVKKNNMEVDFPSFLDHENEKSYKKNARENMQKLKFSFNSSNAEAPPVSAAPQTDDSKSVIAEAQPSTKPVEKSKIINDTGSDGSGDDNHQPIIKRTAKSTINSDDFSNISVDSDMSSPMEIKKEFISPNSSPKNDSNGYSPPSEHALMAAKAIMG
ncbi:hypothetical protein AYI70_g8599 [Smittium culicis]|uniref:Uncharacterized protein n=1 Tax=Smittium culicis TaxID=133412 RepID=A0A1R1XF79_9FUNG|nr:hypothetical protein AYI70_g8599 [Smittium culicis]